MNGGEGQAVSEATRLSEKSMGAFEAAIEADTTAEQNAQLRVARDAAGDATLAVAYVFLQQLVGIIAVALPPAVAIGAYAIDGTGIQDSISAYYYTATGNVFVGALCALGVFFFSYQHEPLPGYELDRKLSYGASAAAIGVALFPTAEHQPKAWTDEWFVSTTHLLCACALFVLLAYFSLKLFTRTGTGPVTDAKRRRNVIFRVCGWTIVAVIVLVAASNVVRELDSWISLFALETIGVEAFGISWLVKSGIFGILADRITTAGPTPTPPIAEQPATPSL